MLQQAVDEAAAEAARFRTKRYEARRNRVRFVLGSGLYGCCLFDKEYEGHIIEKIKSRLENL